MVAKLMVQGLVTPALSLVSKLMVQGRQSAAVLEAQLHEHTVVQELAAEILACCDRVLVSLHAGRKRKSGPGGPTSETRPKRSTCVKRVEKMRKLEDGFMWRKYGQKEILNSKHPRLYFRCSYGHRDDGGCPATKQVQQSEEDPSLYVVTYFGHHTCSAPSEVTQPFVIHFGERDLREGGDGAQELRAKVAKIEQTPPSVLQQAAEPSSSGDASCFEKPWDPMAHDWDCFDGTTFYCFDEFSNFPRLV